MCYTMKRQQHFIQSLREHRTSPFPNMDRDGNVKMTEHRIYIGLNDAETGEQKFETERYLETLKEVCRNYCYPLSHRLIRCMISAYSAA